MSGVFLLRPRDFIGIAGFALYARHILALAKADDLGFWLSGSPHLLLLRVRSFLAMHCKSPASWI
jgi:hypothetical protein